jgi:hypothetical protein
MELQKYLGTRTPSQMEIIKGILLLHHENKDTFTAEDIAKKCNLLVGEMGGAFTSLTNKSKDYPALLLPAGRLLEKDTNQKRHYTQYWKMNPELPWKQIKEEIERI